MLAWADMQPGKRTACKPFIPLHSRLPRAEVVWNTFYTMVQEDAAATAASATTAAAAPAPAGLLKLAARTSGSALSKQLREENSHLSLEQRTELNRFVLSGRGACKRRWLDAEEADVQDAAETSSSAGVLLAAADYLAAHLWGWCPVILTEVAVALRTGTRPNR